MNSGSTTEDYDAAGLLRSVQVAEAPWFGKAMYYLLPIRRRQVMENLRLVFGQVLSSVEIKRLAQAYYGHFARFLVEFLRLPFLSAAQRSKIVRVENEESAIRAW